MSDSQIERAIKILDLKPEFKNQEINTAITDMQSVLSELFKKYPTKESFNKNVSLDDEFGDLSLVLLSSADSFGDLGEEAEVRTILQMLWESE